MCLHYGCTYSRFIIHWASSTNHQAASLQHDHRLYCREQTLSLQHDLSEVGIHLAAWNKEREKEKGI